MLRGTAAQLVLIGHAYALVVALPDTQHGARSAGNSAIEYWLWKFLEALTGRGMDAVVVFFVVSGLLVGYPAIKKIKTQTFSFKNFVLRRIARLSSVVVPGLLVGGLIVKLSFELGAAATVVTSKVPWFPLEWASGQTTTVNVLICNLVYLQTTVCPQFGLNSSLWSLANELHYYLLFPAFLIIFYRSNGLQIQSVALAILILIIWTIPFFTNADSHRTILFAIGFFIWIVGAVAPYLILAAKRAAGSGYKKLSASALLLICTLFFYITFTGYIRSFAIVGLTLWVFFHGDSIDNFITERVTIQKLVTLFSDFSFSLYVIHLPLIVAYLSFKKYLPTFFQHESAPLLQFIALLVLCNTLAWLFYRAFERHHDKWYGVFVNTFGTTAKSH